LKEIKKLVPSIEHFSFRLQLLAVECHLSLDDHKSAIEVVIFLSTLILRNILWENKYRQTIEILNERVKIHYENLNRYPFPQEYIQSPFYKSLIIPENFSSILLKSRLNVIIMRKILDPILSIRLLSSESDQVLKWYHAGLLNCKWKSYSIAIVFFQKALKFNMESELGLNKRRNNIILKSIAVAMLHIGVITEPLSKERLEEFNFPIIEYI
jgi:hypothetical protein